MKRDQSNRILPFVFLILLYQSGLAFLVFVYGYNGSFLLLNGFRNSLLDAPMFLLTHLGDALILTSLLGMIFFRRQPALVILLISVVIITGLTGQLMKNLLFDAWDRPLGVFGESAKVHTVYGYRLFRNSFPSGHSITVTAALTSIAMVFRPKKSAMMALAILTALVSYTRIYVGVHFVGDVLAGTIIGFAGSIYITSRFYPGMLRWIDSLTMAALQRLKTILLVLAVSGFATGIVLIADYLRQMFPAF